MAKEINCMDCSETLAILKTDKNVNSSSKVLCYECASARYSKIKKQAEGKAS